MEFWTDYRNYTTRYFGGPSFLIIIMWGLFLGSLFYEELSFFLMFKRFFFSEDNMTLYLSYIAILPQIIGYLSTNKNPKLLKLDPDFLTFYFFRHPTLKLKYSEISSLEYTKDFFKNFEFTLKNGEKKMIYSTLRNSKQAFEEIQKKLKNTNLDV